MNPNDQSTSPLPPRIRTALTRGLNADTPNTAFVLSSVAAKGWPHVALLSRGEVVMITEAVLRIALHAGSQTTANLTETGRATLLLVEEGVVGTIEISAESLGVSELADKRLSLFEAHIIDAREHTVPYATVTSGITFELHDAGLTMERWSETVALLRGLKSP